MQKIAIIGAGLSGLTLANQLKNHFEITLFEKSRGVGGRMSTRYSGTYTFNHGAGHFTITHPAFKEFLKLHLKNGTIIPTTPKMVTIQNKQMTAHQESILYYTVHPRMNHLCKILSTDIDVHLNTEINSLSKEGLTWSLMTKQNKTFKYYNWIISTAPGPQTMHLLPLCFSQHKKLSHYEMQSCICLMLGFKNPLKLDFDIAVVKNEPIERIHQQTHHTLIIQTTHDWARANQSSTHIEQSLLDNLRQLIRIPQPYCINHHFWRYAKAQSSLNQPYLIDSQEHLAACGDWVTGSTVESAFLSALYLSEQIMHYL